MGSLSNDAILIDVNKDARLDLVEDGGVALGNGNGTFGALKPFPGGLAFGKPQPTAFAMHLAVGDLNGDGISDVAASWVPPGMSPFGSEVFVLLGDGKGDFTANQLDDTNLLVQEVSGIAIGTLVKGGHPSIVLANNTVNPSGGENVDAVIFTGDGKGNFQESAATAADLDTGSSGAVAILDFQIMTGLPIWGSQALITSSLHWAKRTVHSRFRRLSRSPWEPARIQLVASQLRISTMTGGPISCSPTTQGSRGSTTSGFPWHCPGT